MNDQSSAIAKVRFLCSLCGKEAGSIELFGTELRAEIRRKSFTSTLTSVVPAETLEQLRKAVEVRDARALHTLDLEYAPFFCPQCDACYCGDHWVKWDVFDKDEPHWHDSIRVGATRDMSECSKIEV